MASDALSSLIHSLRKRLAPYLSGEPPVLFEDNQYRLNTDGGVSVDVDYFERLVRAGGGYMVCEKYQDAFAAYSKAMSAYTGDLCDCLPVVEEADSLLVQRERLKTLYMTALCRVAVFYYQAGKYESSLDTLNTLLLKDPCREDAHRLAMRCYLLKGERAQALHQYRLCTSILEKEFEAPPEEATVELYDRIRLCPESIVNVDRVTGVLSTLSPRLLSFASDSA